MAKKKWMKGAFPEKTKGDLHRHYGIPLDQKIPVARMKADKARLAKKAAGDKELTKAELKLYRQINAALTAGRY